MEITGGAAQAAAVLKRKRTPDIDTLSNAPKVPKTSAHLAINYLARQYNEDLPLITTDDSLPNILSLLNDYHGILDRHESMACNLGARPLGPILIKRFERLFDGPPKVLKTHGKEGTTVTWLDVVEFARSKPEQFTLGQMSEGVRVCQFYTKQCRVQISEEDYCLIVSGMPQKLIPPQPIIEDEEKELGTLEILENHLNSITSMADSVAARGRQLRHRITGRKQAILDRRATDVGVSVRSTSPSNVALINSNGNGAPINHSPGFVSVNARQVLDSNGAVIELSKTGASQATHNELLSRFFTVNQHRARNTDYPLNGERRESISTSLAVTPGAPPKSRTDMPAEHTPLAHPPSMPSNPQSPYHPPPPIASTSTPKDNEGPFKAEMVARMEAVKRGERIMPPCDRCRRLHMDCIKNLTACLGCTKKHAKCGWKDVRAEELSADQPISLPANPIDLEHHHEELRQPPHYDGSSNGPIQHGQSNGHSHARFVVDSPNIAAGAGMAGARALALDATTAAGLAQAAKASMEASEAEALAQSRTPQPHQPHPTQVQSPNLVPSLGRQSPDHSSYSPRHQRPPSGGPSSLNLPPLPHPGSSLASPGNGHPSEDPHHSRLRDDHPPKEPFVIRPGDSSLLSS